MCYFFMNGFHFKIGIFMDSEVPNDFTSHGQLNISTNHFCDSVDYVQLPTRKRQLLCYSTTRWASSCCFGCIHPKWHFFKLSYILILFFLDCSFGFLLRLFATTYSSVYKQVYNLWPYYFIFSTKQDCFSNQIRGSIMK